MSVNRLEKDHQKLAKENEILRLTTAAVQKDRFDVIILIQVYACVSSTWAITVCIGSTITV